VYLNGPAAPGIAMLRVRFAPPPTGFSRIDGARPWIVTRLYARSDGGQIVLRIDDSGAGPGAFRLFTSIGRENPL
jgi:glutamyl/glutaminyl-tRNA synthetase